MDDFLRALDVGRLKRFVMTKLVDSLNGKSKLVIRQAGNDITFTSIGPNNPEGTATRYVVGKRDNINENPFIGKTLVDLYWETSTDGRRVLVGDLQKEDGTTAQQRRSLVEGDESEYLLMETIKNGACMSQRYERERRSAQSLQAIDDEADSAGDGTINDDENAQLELQQKEQRSFETSPLPVVKAAPVSMGGGCKSSAEVAIMGRCRARNDADENAHIEKQQTEQQSLEVYTSTDAVEEKDEPTTALPPCTRGCMCWTRCVQRVHVLPGQTASVGLYDPVDQSINL